MAPSGEERSLRHARQQARLICHKPSWFGMSSGITFDCTSDMDCAQHGTAFKLLAGYRVAPNAALKALHYDQGKATLTNTRPDREWCRFELERHGGLPHCHRCTRETPC